jgi:hypothetical protein
LCRRFAFYLVNNAGYGMSCRLAEHTETLAVLCAMLAMISATDREFVQEKDGTIRDIRERQISWDENNVSPVLC